MNTFESLRRYLPRNSWVVWVLLAAVFITDFITPARFAHAYLYLPVLFLAMTLPGATEEFKKRVLLVSILCAVFFYGLTNSLFNTVDWYVIGNRVLAISLMFCAYFYFQLLKTAEEQKYKATKQEFLQRKMLDDFIDALPVQVWLANNEGEVDFVGTNLVNFTGKSKDVILDDWLACLHPDDRERTVETWTRSVQTGEPYHIDFRLQRYDGEYIWFDTQAVAKRDEHGTITRWLGSSMDIHDLRQLRDESAQLARQFRLTVESITDAFFTLDHNFCFTYLNHKAAEIMHDSIEILTGESIFNCRGVDTHSRLTSECQRAAKEQKSLSFEEYCASNAKWFEVNIYPSPDGLTVYLSDITERMAMDHRLRESQKLEALGHLTGGLAHDFNNLLTVILGNSEILADEIKDDALRTMAEITVSAAMSGAELTNRLLAFARQQPLDPKATNINELAESILPLISRTLTENIELVFKPESGLWITEVDAGELNAALLNLVVNARDAMKDGGVLTIETQNILLNKDDEAHHPELLPGEYIMLSVSDTGTGMTPETLSRAFEPFFTTKPVDAGSGLGLSMVFGFTKQSGGHISIDSELGKGSSLKLYFPRLAGVQPVKVLNEERSRPPSGDEHILVVEDNMLVLQHIESQLSLLGYRVTVVTSGPEALIELKAGNDIDLLLTDIIMPGGMNGRELADQALEMLPDLKVLYTSGYTDHNITHQGRLDAGVELLRKPYTQLKLAEKVRYVLNKE